MVMRAVEFARCLCIPGALGFEWVGDRANTLTKSLNEPELRAILGPVLRELPESRSSSRPSKSD